MRRLCVGPHYGKERPVHWRYISVTVYPLPAQKELAFDKLWKMCSSELCSYTRNSDQFCYFLRNCMDLYI
jgi:hypothetical protein